MQSQLEQRIRAKRLLDLPADWQHELIFPNYDGLCIQNVPNTVMSLLGATPPNQPLDAAVWGGDELQGQIDRVVVFVSDGFGYLWLRQLMSSVPAIADVVAELTDDRAPVPLTSIAPSTTAVALPTLWTGLTPAQHGMVGTVVFLRELSMLASVLRFKPAVPKTQPEILGEWGLAPERFLEVPTLAERLEEVGVQTHLLLPYNLMGSGLSRIMHRGVQNEHIHMGASDFWLRVGDVLRQTAKQRAYVNIYLPSVDMLSHTYGAHNFYLQTEVQQQLTQLNTILNNPAMQDGRTLFMLLADHGHLDDRHIIDLDKHPRAAPLKAAMRGSLGGETRFGYMYIRDTYRQQVIDTIERHFADSLTWVDRDTALQAGLFGGGDIYIETPHRLGDIIVITRPGYAIVDKAHNYQVISRHGGLSEWEMLVPLLWKRI